MLSMWCGRIACRKVAAVRRVPGLNLLRYWTGVVCGLRAFVLCVVCTVSGRDFDFTNFVNATTAFSTSFSQL